LGCAFRQHFFVDFFPVHGNILRRSEELAREYMLQSEYSVADVCFLLGFTDQSNFAKAFKRWTGLSPTAYRREHVTGH
jgi:AraC-like DNA-binding protein